MGTRKVACGTPILEPDTRTVKHEYVHIDIPVRGDKNCRTGWRATGRSGWYRHIGHS